MRRLVGMALVAVVAGCGGAKIPPGLVAGKGGSCTAQSDCASCSQCRPAGQEVCLSQTCYLASAPDTKGEPTLTDGMVVATLPSGAGSEVKSASVRILYPLRTDGSKVTCAALLADPTGVDADATLNVLRSLDPAVQLPATATQVSLGANELPVGSDRVALAVLHASTGGNGAVVTAGCTEHLSLASGKACTGDGDCTYPKKCEMVSGRSECGPQQIVVKTTRP